MQPIISVIVPVYNVEPYLEECVRSIRNQTLRDIEIILIDDGSPDNCPRMCDQYAREDERIQVIHQKNAGVSAARNAGLRVAKGKYIAFVDPDDWVDPDYLSIMLDHMVPGGMAVCNFVLEWNPIMKRASTAIHLRKYEAVVLDRTDAQSSVLRHSKGDKIKGFSWCKLYDRRLLETQQVAFCEDLTYIEDEVFVLQYLSHITEKVVCVNEICYHYRYRRQSVSNFVIRRYGEFDPQIFSGNVAVEREFRYIEHTPIMQRYYQARSLEAKKVPVTIMEINGWKNCPQYKKYLREIRAGLFPYLRYGGCPLSKKICTVLCAIHPRLYYLCRIAGFFVLETYAKAVAVLENINGKTGFYHCSRDL